MKGPTVMIEATVDTASTDQPQAEWETELEAEGVDLAAPVEPAAPASPVSVNMTNLAAFWDACTGDDRSVQMAEFVSFLVANVPHRRLLNLALGKGFLLDDVHDLDATGIATKIAVRLNVEAQQVGAARLHLEPLEGFKPVRNKKVAAQLNTYCRADEAKGGRSIEGIYFMHVVGAPSADQSVLDIDELDTDTDPETEQDAQDRLLCDAVSFTGVWCAKTVVTDGVKTVVDVPVLVMRERGSELWSPSDAPEKTVRLWEPIGTMVFSTVGEMRRHLSTIRGLYRSQDGAHLGDRDSVVLDVESLDAE